MYEYIYVEKFSKEIFDVLFISQFLFYGYITYTMKHNKNIKWVVR